MTVDDRVSSIIEMIMPLWKNLGGKMTDEDLIEAGAKAICRALDWDFSDSAQSDVCRRAIADAVAAIESSGAHAVVPIVPTDEMLTASHDAGVHDSPGLCYAAMVSARPKVKP